MEGASVVRGPRVIFGFMGRHQQVSLSWIMRTVRIRQTLLLMDLCSLEQYSTGKRMSMTANSGDIQTPKKTLGNGNCCTPIELVSNWASKKFLDDNCLYFFSGNTYAYRLYLLLVYDTKPSTIET